MKKIALFLTFAVLALASHGQDSLRKAYVFPIREPIMPSTARLTEKCLREALEMNAACVVIDMNTYGGLMDAADSIRTALINFPLPVLAFVNNQAASAGALIAIAADSIYMREGASIGAATVVDQAGEVVPDKYQSFMRSMMRSTAESHGKRPVVNGTDTTWQWVRDPKIAEAMVDPSIYIKGLIDSLKVLTFTAEEAIKWNYCEGKASSVSQVLDIAGMGDYQIYEYKPTDMDRLMGWLTNPALQGILIMLIIAGIYFELQTPGVGFPLIISILAALLYFAPLYVEGLAAHWEIAVFVLGIVLLILEVFVTPGFGVLGITGIVAIIVGLAFAMIDLSLLRYIPTGELSAGYVLKPLLTVATSIIVAFVLCIWFGPRFLKGGSRLQKKVVLATAMDPGEGYVSREGGRGLEGTHGIVTAVLRPSGRIQIDGSYYEATGEDGAFIEKGARVEVVRDEGGVLYCRKL